MYKNSQIQLSDFDNHKNKFEIITEYDCTPSQLFSIFEDANSWPQWAESIINVEWTSPKPFGLGTTRTVTMQGDLKGYEEFIAWENNKRMTFQFLHCNKKFIHRFGEDYRVKDLGEGRCELTWIVIMELNGFLGLISPLMRGLMQKRFRSIMQDGLSNYIANNQ